MSAVVSMIRPKYKPTVQLETITPSMAQEWLQTMRNNRVLNQGKAVEYAIVMDEKNWSVNGETIKFDSEGRLFDGQHRLQACILAGKPFQAFVARGISDPDAFSTVDVGKNRSHGDIFGIAGYPSGTLCSVAAMLVYKYRNGILSITSEHGGQRRWAKGSKEILKKLDKLPVKSVDVTKEDLLHFAEPFKDRLIAAVRHAETMKLGKLGLTAGTVAGSYFLFCEKSETDAKRFFADLSEGVGLSGSDPVYWLRERLIANRAAPHKLQRGAVLMLLFKAWNKRRNGEKTKVLKLIEGEVFPKVK